MRFQTLFEARWIFLVLLVLAIISLLASLWLALLFILLIGYTLFFFRDPERVAPADPDLIVAAADGVVVEIVELEETEDVRQTMGRVAIFLSVFDVHTDPRRSIGGSLPRTSGRSCLDARNPECSVKNESMTWAFENPRATLVVRQITGAIARRIVGWSQRGYLAQGRTLWDDSVWLPHRGLSAVSATLFVQVGERVAGGATAIARLSQS